MISNLPAYILISFFAAVVLTYFFLAAAAKSRSLLTGFVFIWLTITGIAAASGFFADTYGMPPKFMLAVLPALLFIILLFNSTKGKNFIDSLDLRMLALLHIVRIPVEGVLYWLAAQKAVPELMTFEGRNFDILSGITAPVMYFLCFSGKQVKSRGLLLAWNIICLGLLLNIVINAVLSAPFSFQQFAFEQPNIAVLYFPFVWLPAFIVMAVLFSHLVVLRRLLRK